LNIEGLGRELDPELDLWQTAQPYLERWMAEQLGWRGLLSNLEREAPQWASLLPELPRLMHRALARDDDALRVQLAVLQAEQLRQSRILTVLALMLAGLAGALILLF
jgi:ubiquinone biosynthesis protein